jgi:hypothetical protein
MFKDGNHAIVDDHQVSDFEKKGWTTTETIKTAKPKKAKRARNADGTLKGDDKSTPDVNEAWE